MNHDYIIGTNWDKVDADDFYLTDKWAKNEGLEDIMPQARELQAQGELYEAYIVKALNYCIYYQMDADKVFIDKDFNVILRCESAVISNDLKKVIEYEI